MRDDMNPANATSEKIDIEGLNVTIYFASEKNQEAEEQLYKLLAQSLISKLRM